MKYEEIINKMTLEEKASLCVGKDYWNSENIERLGIPSIKMSDGPHGLRVQKENGDNLGVNKSEVAICFPSSATIANSWDKDVVYKLGKTLGEEAKSENINIVLGPGVNIKRSPLGGRNFEYFSEDPYLTGTMATQYVKGLQSNNVGACVKHFALNNQENRRRTINVVVDERTLREIYLKAFEMIVKEAKPWTVMSAYNKLNGKYCTENEVLLGILKKEWNFDGIVITDWGAENDRVKGLAAGNELEMPGGRGNGKEEIIQAVKDGKVSEKYLDKIVDRILNIAFKCERAEQSYNKEEHHEIAMELAQESIVLLKNEDNMLPINKRKIALIGDMAKNPRYQGAGSSTINPYKVENAYDCFIQNGIEVDYARGYNRIESDEDKELVNQAVEVAINKEAVILFLGLTENYESEGMDRTSLEIPKNQIKLIESIYSVNQNIIVVLSNGAPITMKWKDKAKAIITGYLGGESGAKAMVNCILGKVNPSGKLAETYPIKLEDTPCFNNFPGTEISVEYKESIYVGYRYYDKNNIKVLYPFGYGLSYTTFEYSNLNVKNNVVSFKIKNTGKVKGKEIAQVYVSQCKPTIFKPLKELKGFEKVELEPDEEKEVNITLDDSAFQYYNVQNKKWEIEAGEYKILVGKSCESIELECKIYIDSKDKKPEADFPDVYRSGKVQNVTDEDFEKLLGQKIPDRYIKLEDVSEDNTLEQIKNTKVGKVIYENQIQKMNKLLEEQNVNKATKVMMDMQKPLKKFYEKKSSKYTKEMVDELINIAKNDLDYKECKFVNEYLK